MLLLTSCLPQPLPQIEVCVEQMAWARTEKRTFLRQRIELRLASLYLDRKMYQESLALIGTYVPGPDKQACAHMAAHESLSPAGC